MLLPELHSDAPGVLMCRLLCVHSDRPFGIEPHLGTFAAIARDSREYQGHGWGCAWLEDGRWRLYHDIRPVWEDRHDRFGETTLLLAHARSAFRDEGIRVENNMPFADGRHVFVFNGELRGVRIRERGRIGAEKVFNYVKRFDRGDMHEALERGLAVIGKRSRYVRAMNVILASAGRVHVACRFAEDPGYFQMWEREAGGTRIVCSDPYPGAAGWSRIGNGAVLTCALAGSREPCGRRERTASVRQSG